MLSKRNVPNLRFNFSFECIGGCKKGPEMVDLDEFCPLKVQEIVSSENIIEGANFNLPKNELR